MYIPGRLSEDFIDMARFDPTHMARFANEQLKTITEPHRRKILINFRDHALAESMGDYDALMATCSRRRQSYEVFADTDNEFTRHQPQSYDELVPHYRALIDSNMYLIHGEPEKLIVGDDSLMAQMVQHMIVPGVIAKLAFGVDEAAEDGVYLFTTRLAVIFIFDEDGMGCGEHAFGGKTDISQMRLLEHDEIPGQYFSGPRKVEDFFAANPGLEWPLH
ncbi:MAG: hypothetical protein R3228_04575 [Halioglobus sp.]|nr:hypothetical protein [Halioglobus sp.]